MNKKLFFFLFLLFPILSGCTRVTDVKHPPTRTILAYFSAGNNLDEEVAMKRETLIRGFRANDEINGELFIFTETRGKFPVLERINHRGSGNNKIDTISIYSDKHTPSAELVHQVIGDLHKHSRADHKGLIVFGHGTGWLPQGGLSQPRSIFSYEGKEMDFDQFAKVLPDGGFDFIVFDMCFMAGIETTYALRNKASHIVASSAEVVSPGFGAVYENSLYRLYRDKPDLKGFATDFFNNFNSKEGLYRSATVSVIKTAGLEALAKSVKKSLKRELTENDLRYLQPFDRLVGDHLFFDFGDYLAKILSAHDFKGVNELLQKVVIYKQCTEKFFNRPINAHSGLSVFIPQKSLPVLSARYHDLDWYRDAF